MVKLVALFKTPKSPEDFDSFYGNTVVPALRSLPGVQRLETTRVSGAPFGESKYHMMAELYFADRGAMDAALSSAEGKGLARSLLRLAPDVAALFHGETDY